MRICGQWFSETILANIVATLQRVPDTSRSALAEQVCGWLGWNNARGEPQLGGARKALAELDRRGAIALPPTAARPVRDPALPARDTRVAQPVAQPSVTGDLASLGAIRIERVDTAAQRALYRQLMQQHPLGDKPLCGAQLRYLFASPAGYLGAAAFQSASFALQARDTWIGWSESIRRANLARVVANARFLILPTVRVPHLASHLLGRLTRQLPDDWEAQYGVRALLLETFVHPDYDGTCYKAAGWIDVGHSAGRRDGVAKAIWLRPLAPDARDTLRGGPARVARERPEQPKDWIENEFGGLRLWDARLKTRLYQVAEDFWSRLQSPSLTRRCADRARTMGAYRFFQNPKVNMPILLEAHRQAVIERMAEHPLVLVPQDTTTLNYTGHRDAQAMGPIGTRIEGGPIGLVLHNSHAFTPEGVPLGVVSADCWARDPEAHGQRRAREERESRKWLDAYATLQEIAPQLPNTTLVSIGDREADLFELFALAQDPQSPRLLVRAHKGRGRKVMDDAALTPLWEHVGGLEPAGRLELHLPRRGSRRARRAELEVRFAPVKLKAPNLLKEAPIDLWAVYLWERDPPAGSEAVEWLLLTNVATTRYEEALERARWYSARWGIEVFHRTLKTGCQIEDRQLGFRARLENCLAVDLVMAWRVYYLTLMGRVEADLPCTVFFQDPEWKALYSWHHNTTQLPDRPPTLKETVRWIAEKGGFQGRKSDGDPGVEVLWHGLQKLDVAIDMYLIYRPAERSALRSEYPPWYLRPDEDAVDSG
jgi:hypothetical protein